jgi:hypothetical protein
MFYRLGFCKSATGLYIFLSYVFYIICFTGWGFVNRLPDYTFSCCGVISKWEVHVKAAGDLEIQVWRPSGTNEQLVGENVLKVRPGKLTFLLSLFMKAVNCGVGGWDAAFVLRYQV